MKVFILTSYTKGFPCLVLKQLIESRDIKIAGVVYSKNTISNKKRFYIRKLKKICKIGILGAIIGYRMRRWYSNDSKFLPSTLPLDKICEQENIPYYTIERTNNPNNETINIIQSLDPDLGLSLGNEYISRKIFSIPRQGMINVHHELLPEYMGAQSVIWQLYNMSKVTGYTIHKINHKIDGGTILLKRPIPIEFKDTLAETVEYNYAKLKIDSAQKLVEVIKDLHNKESLSKSDGIQYTTPNFRQFLKIKRNFIKLART